MNSIDSPSKHKDITQSKPQHPPESTRSSFFPIDLNEIPSSSDSFDIVRSIHDDALNLNPPPRSPPPPSPPLPPLPPISIPTGPSSSSSSCGACGRPEEDAPSGGGHVVVCDGCERGFHLACAGIRALNVEDWVCGECEKRGVKSQAWPLGFKPKKKRVLDMNASPPSDGDGDIDGSERRLELRKHNFGDNPLGRNSFDARARHSSFPFAGKGFNFDKVVGFLNHPSEISYEHNQQNVQTGFKNFEVNLGFPVGNLSSKNLAIGLSPRNPSDVFLQALREFISQRHGVLDHGWHVEFKQSMSNCGIEALYCAPNGMKFESMSEVASYLGLGSNHILGEKTIDREGLVLQGKFHLPRKRKYSSRSLGTDVFSESKGLSTQAFEKDLSSDNHCAEVIVSNGDNVKATESCSQENPCLQVQQSYEGLPLQFEDFFLLCLGEIDLRPSYHDIQQIWPVGYRSCWHDKVTGSLFFCEVSDGGDCGPFFKIRRCSCSSVPLPNRSTIIFRQEPEQNATLSMEESCNVVSSCVDNEECIQMMLADPFQPQENDILSCFEGSSSAACDIMINGMHSEAGSISVYHDYDFKDAIGEISVEEKSSSSAWMKLSQEFVNAFVDICDKKGPVKLYCKHVKHETMILNQNRRDEKSRSHSEALMKFCSSPFMLGPGKTDVSINILKSWLGQDRFGLNMEFVQEIIEHLPGAKHCSRYELLHSRDNYLELFTVGNGKLVKRKDTVDIGDKEMVDQHASLDETHEKCIPPGMQLCSKLSPELVGDYYQVWEVLRRFHEILGLKEPLLLNELEDAIVDPWSDHVHYIGNIETEPQRSQVSSMNSVDRGDDRVSSSSNASSSGVCGDSTCNFTRMEKEVAASLATSVSGANSRCFGVTLTVVHSLLLGVLIGELQSKVAALVDPNFDTSDFKPKRGRRKDVDSSVLAKRMKPNLLPINELSWPELARRYILATQSMDGSSDFSDESRKVFRCLQGDGGVLCGSVTGIAGIEADALLLAEAMKKIFGPLSKEKGVLVMEEDTADSDACEKSLANESNLPEWAQALIPVKKLPTNVGTRIRKCVYDALAKGPPDWAKERLEHSISKEIYKGNASGPTKKAVLSVLEDISAERLPQKPEERKKRKRIIAISDIIMKQCQVILRQAAAEDEEKRFCNLLGRKLMNTSDNDDGLLGSPAMVARPLDFRTIDRRLAAGAYGGSHEAFLEDVRELWNNLRTAFSDKPDLVDLTSRLSQHFELLYEEEVVPVFQRLTEYAELDSLDRETKNEVDEFLSSLSELPKAPWDEGVCKVCGVDRDDDSVLLCDTCDAEYHMYCLDPPLARIPEGNWYCPSCVVDRKIVQDVSVLSRVFRRHRGKKYQEVTRDYLESLSHLASVMEEKEFWEYSIAERIFLLKFLCDELLNSALVRQHLEQCGEVSAELQQKLRSLSLDCRNLKAKEEFLALRVGKDEAIVPGTPGDLPVLANSSRCVALEHDRSHHLTSVLKQQIDDRKEKSVSNGFGKNSSEMINLSYDETSDTTETGGQVKDVDTAGRESKLPGGNVSCTTSTITDVLHEEANGSEKVSPEKTSNVQPPFQDIGCSDACGSKEPVAYDVELKSVKKEISVLQDSINSLELQLLNVALRREFLGGDSVGRLYWAAAMPGRGMHIIVDGSLMARNKQKISDNRPRDRSLQEGAFSAETYLSVQGSKAPCPFLYEANRPMSVSPTWISYQTDAEIEELLGWFNDTDVKERALKEAILHWLKFRLRDDQCKDLVTDVHKRTISLLPGENFFSINLATKAASMLEKNHGHCLEPEAVGIVKKRGKKTKVTTEGKMYRCECLEPIWSSRYHCPVCHKTFLKAIDIEEHTNEKSCVPFFEKCKVTANNRKGSLKSPAAVSEGMIERNVGENDCLQQSKLSNFQKEGLACPYDLEEISARFITEDSSKELVQQIGLIGSKGNLIFLSSISPHLDDITLVIPSGVTSEAQDKRNTSETQIIESFSESPVMKKHETKNSIKSVASSGKKERKCLFGSWAAEQGVDICCIVPQSSLKPLTGKHSEILRQLKIALLDMDAAVSEVALRSSKACLERRWAWRSSVKSAETIYEMIQATIIFEDMIKTQYLRNDWWYWSSLSAACRTSTLSALALRIYSLDSAILYEKTMPELDSVYNWKSSGAPDQTPQSNPDSTEKPRPCRKSNRKRKEPES